MRRFARDRRVFFVEEPWFDAPTPRLAIEQRQGVQVAVPHLPEKLEGKDVSAPLRALLDDLVERQEIVDPVLWYYTPMALDFSRHLPAAAVVYDCMDELSAFAKPPAGLLAREAELFGRADVVFTGGQSLFEAKRTQHPFVHCFPSSVDVSHFAQAREHQEDPHDQASIPRPRIGFFGVIDERMDLDLLAGIATTRPDWQLVLVGPRSEKADTERLPHNPTVHYLGAKGYEELPAYLAGWDVAILPFARNKSTQFISPTKTPEYLAAGKPVVSTSIRDVVTPYGKLGLVRIADTVEAFVREIEGALREEDGSRQAAADRFLAQLSWERTWSRMNRLVDEVIAVDEAVTSGSSASRQPLAEEVSRV
jgi:UDP-galactopyranose mutase